MTRIIFAIIAAALPFTPAPAAPRDGMAITMPEDPRARAVFEEWGFAQTVTHGEVVYVSGVVAGLRPGETDQAAAYDRAFLSLTNILARAGSSWDDVIELTTFHTDVTTQFAAFRQVKDRYVKAPFPAWTAIDIDRLIPDNGLVEIKLIARKRR